MKLSSLICSDLIKTTVWCGACCFGLVPSASNLDAQSSLGVLVSGAQFTTYVEASGYDATTGPIPSVSRNNVSATPISDELAFPVSWANVTNYAIANAGLLTSHVQTGWGIAYASATSQLWFSPLSDQTQTIGIYISCGGLSVSDDGSVSLLDLTSNTELWNYSWGMANVPPANFPWNSGPYSTANFNVDTDFFASHQYELTMETASQAGSDDESAQIQLTGLAVVPEPSSTSLLLTICSASLMFIRRQRR
jgi:hypothetical protein